MSLDVYLEDEQGEEVYWANITHNLAPMARAAGIYKTLWCPQEVGARMAQDLVPRLQAGLRRLVENPYYFQTYNSPNGWGLYSNFVPWVERYLKACEAHPYASVKVSR